MQSAAQITPVLSCLPFCVDTWRSGSGQTQHQYLTHAHKDHLLRITAAATHIFCTAVTRDLVLLKYPAVADRAKFAVLVECEEYQFEAPNHPGLTYRVTPVPANHCDGAVSYLFTSSWFGNILHTGDVRVTPSYTAAVKRFLQGSALDLLYVDSTFGTQPLDFPLINNAIEQVIDTIKSHSKIGKVLLCCEALGTEEVLRAVSQRFQTKVYMPPPCACKQLSNSNSYDSMVGSSGQDSLNSTTLMHLDSLERCTTHLQALSSCSTGDIAAAVNSDGNISSTSTSCCSGNCWPSLPKGAKCSIGFQTEQLHCERYQELQLLCPDILSSDSSCRFWVHGGRYIQRHGRSILTQQQQQCAKGLNQNVLVIKTSTQAYAQADKGYHQMLRPGTCIPAPKQPRVQDGVHFVLYSRHSSRQEVMQALVDLQPRAVVPFCGDLASNMRSMLGSVRTVEAEIRVKVMAATAAAADARSVTNGNQELNSQSQQQQQQHQLEGSTQHAQQYAQPQQPRQNGSRCQHHLGKCCSVRSLAHDCQRQSSQHWCSSVAQANQNSHGCSSAWLQSGGNPGDGCDMICPAGTLKRVADMYGQDLHREGKRHKILVPAAGCWTYAGHGIRCQGAQPVDLQQSVSEELLLQCYLPPDLQQLCSVVRSVHATFRQG